MNIIEYKYDASPGLRIEFKAKSFICETSSYLYIISPAKFDEVTFNKIKSFSKDIIIIAPNNFHNIGLSFMKEKFPDAKFYGPKRSAKQSGMDLLNTRYLPEDSQFTAVFLEGNQTLSESVFIHTPSKSLIVTDIVFNMHHKMNLISTLVFKAYGTYKRLGQSFVLKLTADDKPLFRKQLRELTKLDFEKVLLNHGNHISRDEFNKFILSSN
jgi:hypothetical protein